MKRLAGAAPERREVVELYIGPGLAVCRAQRPIGNAVFAPKPTFKPYYVGSVAAYLETVPEDCLAYAPRQAG